MVDPGAPKGTLAITITRSPDSAIFALALARSGLGAEEAIFVDDNALDVAATAALGIGAHHFTGVVPLRHALDMAGLLSE